LEPVEKKHEKASVAAEVDEIAEAEEIAEHIEKATVAA